MSQSTPDGPPQGPETITIFSHEKIDGSFIKFKDNQQHVWNCALTEKTADILGYGLGATVQVIYQPMKGQLPDGKEYVSKYINDVRLAPDGTPAQELKEPYQGGSGGGGKGGGSSKGDFRSREEIIACAALDAASRIAGDRQTAMADAEVFYLWIIEKGKQGQPGATTSAAPAGPSFDQPAAAAYAGSAPAPGPSFDDAPAPVAGDGDDDIPF